MRNDAVEKRSRISRKEVESIALQLCNVAGRVNDLKEKLPSLERIISKVSTVSILSHFLYTKTDRPTRSSKSQSLENVGLVTLVADHAIN